MYPTCVDAQSRDKSISSRKLPKVTLIETTMYSNKKEFNDFPEADEVKWKGLTKTQWIVAAAVSLGLLLMIVSGVFVYYHFCQGDPAKTPTAVAKTNLPATGVVARNNVCPMLPATNCPNLDTRPLCPALPCLAQPPPLCPPAPPCPTYAPCSAANCCPTPPPNITMTDNEMVGNTTLNLINRYPVDSYERLQVVMQIMEKWFERYYFIYTRRNCDTAFHQRICVMCNDRYRYLRCVVQNSLNRHMETQTRLTHIPESLLWNINEKARWDSTNSAETDFTKGLGPADYAHSLYGNMQKALSLGKSVTVAGTPNYCAPCDGEDREAHTKCIKSKSEQPVDWNPLAKPMNPA